MTSCDLEISHNFWQGIVLPSTIKRGTITKCNKAITSQGVLCSMFPCEIMNKLFCFNSKSVVLPNGIYIDYKKSPKLDTIGKGESHWKSTCGIPLGNPNKPRWFSSNFESWHFKKRHVLKSLKCVGHCVLVLIWPLSMWDGHLISRLAPARVPPLPTF